MRNKLSERFLLQAWQIAGIENKVNGKAPAPSRYFKAPEGMRLLRVEAVIKALKTGWRPGGANPDLYLAPPNIKAAISWLKHCLFNNFQLPCTADIILWRSNISLFYFGKGIRIKIQNQSPGRCDSDLKNEYDHRKRVANLHCIYVPQLLQGNFVCHPQFFIDEIVPGEVLNWTHPKAPEAFETLIPSMWKYYQTIGIQWLTPEAKGFGISDLIRGYSKALSQKSGLSFPFELSKIEGFETRFAPCSITHGDFAIHNIIIAETGYHLCDWELARFDYIIRDFYRLLIIKNWHLHNILEQLMNKEIEKQFGTQSHKALSFFDQLHFILFLEIHKMLTDPVYPARLLKRAEAEINEFFGRFQKR